MGIQHLSITPKLLNISCIYPLLLVFSVMKFIRQDQTYSWEEYLGIEGQSPQKLEYLDGKIVGMAGASKRHNKIIHNMTLHLGSQLKGRACNFYTENIRLYRFKSRRFLYPDFMLTCNLLDAQSKNSVSFPLLLAEVLSKGSRAIDRGFKLEEYLRIHSLQHYLIIEQEFCQVDHFFRKKSGVFSHQIYDLMDHFVSISQLDAKLFLRDIYEGIEFGPEITFAEEEEANYQN